MTRRAPVVREERVEPTPETVAKLVPDPIQGLFERGLITSEHTTAAAEIRAIYLAVVGSLFCRGRDYSDCRVRTRGNIPERLAVLHRDRYKPWTIAMGRRLPAIMDILIEGHHWLMTAHPDGPPGQRLIIEALNDYVSRMGPVRHTIAIDIGNGMLDSAGRMA
jgi:hypothetical protein